MKSIVGDKVDAMLRKAANDYVRVAKQSVTNRKAVVAVFAYALRAALDELSPDERAAWLELAVAEVRTAEEVQR